MKLESSSSSSPSEMEAEPLWFTGYTTPPIEGQSTPAMEYVDSTSMCPTPPLSAGIWSTETPLLTLPHVTMGAERSNSGGMNGFGGFEMPSQWAFEPVLDGWMSGM